MPHGSQKLFSFGIIADVQHANINDGYNFHRTRMRFYRHALVKFEEAIETWNERKVDFAVQLGDIIDGFSSKYGHRDNDMNNLTAVIKKFQSIGLPVIKRGNIFTRVPDDNSDGEDCEKKDPYLCHIWGNHEFYNFSRSELWNSPMNSYIVSGNTKGSIDEVVPPPSNEKIDSTYGYYYSFTYKGFRFVTLDTYDIGKISRPEGTAIHESSVKMLANEKHNNSRTRKPHLVSWNGGVSNEQLNWLRIELTQASVCGEKVIIFSHIPLHCASSRAASVCWNYEDILAVINTYSGCVVACFAGHFHDGGFYHDMETGIYYMTLQAALERDPATNAYAIADIYSDKIEVKGYGKIETRFLKF